jgi:predicted ATPase/class 3 adenylate cyclase
LRHLIPHFITEKVKQKESEGSFMAYAMFLDMSGFTNLTEHLFKEDGHEGAELMSRILNDIFGPLVSMVYDKGGFIPYFAGDAFTAIFEISSNSIIAEELADTALRIQQDFAKKNEAHKGKEFPIRLKIGLSYGEVEWGIVGKEHKGFYFRGKAINGCAECEHRTQIGEVVIDQPFLDHCINPNSHFTCTKVDEGYYKVLESNPSLEAKTYTSIPELSTEDMNSFLPDSILEYGDSGEFREVVSIFISFQEIDDTAIFNEFASIVREEFYKFSGYFKEIDFGDKGGVIVGFFGAPVTFGDNSERSLEFVLSLKDALAPLQKRTPLVYKVGLTSGMVFTGIIGGHERCQYAAVGNTVNLAARLMVYADWGEVLVDDDINKTKGFGFQHKGDIIYKGFEGPIPTYSLIGKEDQEAFYSGEMIGRDEELESLVEFSEPIFNNTFAGVAVIYGEAGIGKSRLAYETRAALQKIGMVNWHTCQADQILQKPFNPFVYLFRNFFNQSPEQNYDYNKNIFEERFRQLIRQSKKRLANNPELGDIIRELNRTKTIIAARLGLYYPDSLWTQLDAKGRYQNTISSFISILKAEAIITPFVLEVEDGHWFDDGTKALLSELVNAMQHYPACLVITSRYREEDGSKPNFFKGILPEGMPWVELDLNILSPEYIEEFALKKLGGEISSSLRDLLVRTTNGNPFYTEQILEYFIESDLLKQKGEVWSVKDQNIKFSGSINAVLMARIDRLSGLVKETVKAAAVIGREFEVQVLSEVMKTQREFLRRNGDAKHLLQEQIETAEKGQIWKAVNEIRYIFKHSLLREAVYDMQIRTRLRELHKLIAEAIERVYAEQIDSRYADLAFHYEQANIKPKMNEYLEKAGDYAKNNFNNTRAILYYDKLAQSLDHIRQQVPYVKTLLKKAAILNLIGDWNESERVLQNALALASSSSDKLLLGRANNDLGNLLMLKGEYTEAYKYLQSAAVFFEDIDDAIGMSKVYGNIGDVFFRQGEYEKAKDYFKESIRIGKDTNRAGSNFGIVSNLGLALMNQGKYEEAISNMKPYLEHCERNGNKLGVANVSIYLGIVYFEKGDNDEAMECYQKGLKQCEDLGNKFLTAIALGCMGKLLVKKGHFDTALELYERDLILCRELGDKQGTSITLGLLGDLHLEKGEFDLAIKNLTRQLKLSENLHYQKGIASALGSIGDANFHKKEYAKAKTAYEKGIKICDEIDNKRLLVLILLRMVELSLYTNANAKETKNFSRKADDIAEKLGNEELIFMSSLKRTQVELQHGDQEMAILGLKYLLKEAKTPQDKGELYYILGTTSIVDDKEYYKKEGYKIFKTLYEQTPKYDYRVKMDELA